MATPTACIFDNFREAWPYRDWVISAFNANKPFDRFIVEQLAGDLLPNATPDQIIATGYNRCHVSTNEGARSKRKSTSATSSTRSTPMGPSFWDSTTGRARRYDQEYDPILAKDYYQLFVLQQHRRSRDGR